jgi:hypothetical protein
MNNNNKKKINYIYNKQMLKKIQVVDEDRKTNEMEMKNYAEELNTYQQKNNNLKSKINVTKSLTFKNMVFSNSNIPQEWRNKVDYHNFSLKTLSNDKDLTEYLLKNDMLAVTKQENKIRKNAFYSEMIKIRKLEKDKNIARLLQHHKEIKRQISGLIKNDDNFLVTQSIFGENFVITNEYNKLTPAFPSNVNKKDCIKKKINESSLTSNKFKFYNRLNSNESQEYENDLNIPKTESKEKLENYLNMHVKNTSNLNNNNDSEKPTLNSFKDLTKKINNSIKQNEPLNTESQGIYILF